MGDTPTSPQHPPEAGRPLQPFPGVRRSDILGFDKHSLTQSLCYSHTDQEPPNLNSYYDFVALGFR